MHSEETLRTLVGRIYDAAVDPTLWPEAMRGISGMMGAAASVAYYANKDLTEIPLLVQHGVDDAALREFGEHYLSIDPRVDYIARNPRDVVCDYMHHSESEMDRSEYYDWLTNSYNLKYYIGGAIPGIDGLKGYCSVNRTQKQGHADAADMRLFAILKQHLVRSMQIRLKTRWVELGRESALDALDQLRQGVIFVDRDHCIVWMNRFARRLVAASDGLRTVDRRLRAQAPTDSSALSAALKGAIQARSSVVSIPGGAVSVRRSTGHSPLLLLVTPAPQNDAHIEMRATAALVFVSDPETAAGQPTQNLRRFYGLTEREAHLAIALAQGKSVADYADENERSFDKHGPLAPKADPIEDRQQTSNGHCAAGVVGSDC